MTLPDLKAGDLAGKPIGTTYNPTSFNIVMSCNTCIKVSDQIRSMTSHRILKPMAC